MIGIEIIEDDKKLHRNISEILSFYDELSVIGSFSNGEEAIQHLSKQAKRTIPDVYLMDIQLPGISGVEATRQIKSYSPAQRKLSS